MLTLLAGGSALGLACWPNWLGRWPRTVLGAIVLITVFALRGLLDAESLSPRIRIDASSEPLLASGNPATGLYRDAVRNFGHDEIYSIGVVCDEVFSFECLSFQQRVSHRVARLEGVRGVSSLVDVTSLRWDAEEETIEIRPFIEDIPRDPLRLADLRQRALANSVYRQTLVAADAKAAAINVAFQPMDDATFLESGLDSAISRILRDELAAGQGFHVAGRPHIKAHVYEGILRDLGLLIPLAVIVMASVLALFFRSFRGVLIPLGTAMVANVWTFGAIAGLGESLNLLTSLLGPLILASGSVYGGEYKGGKREGKSGRRRGSDHHTRCLLYTSDAADE